MKHDNSRRRNVAAHVAEELKMVTYATPSMEERRKKENNVHVKTRCELYERDRIHALQCERDRMHALQCERDRIHALQCEKKKSKTIN